MRTRCAGIRAGQAVVAAAALCGVATLAVAQQRVPPPQPLVSSPTVDLQLFGLPATIAGSGAWTSQCIVVAPSYRAFAVFGALSGAATLQVQRYADTLCTRPSGAAVPTTALALTTGGGCPSSSYCGTVASNDGESFLAMKLTLTDTSGSSNTVVNATLLLGAE